MTSDPPPRVPLSTVALTILDRLPRRLDGRIWGMRPDSISQTFERVCRAASIEGLTFHDLRHDLHSAGRRPNITLISLWSRDVRVCEVLQRQ